MIKLTSKPDSAHSGIIRDEILKREAASKDHVDQVWCFGHLFIKYLHYEAIQGQNNYKI